MFNYKGQLLTFRAEYNWKMRLKKGLTLYAIPQKEVLHGEYFRRCLKNLFSMGCGFTDFLKEVFFNLPLKDVASSRLVCLEWRDFIDQ